MTHSLRCTGITQLPHYYGAVCPWLEPRYFQPRGYVHLCLSLRISIPGSHVSLWRPRRVHAVCTPAVDWAVNRCLPDSSRELLTSAVLTATLYLTMRQRTVSLRSSPRHSPDTLMGCLFQGRSPPQPLSCSSTRRFETCSCKPISGGLLPSPKQHRRSLSSRKDSCLRSCRNQNEYLILAATKSRSLSRLYWPAPPNWV